MHAGEYRYLYQSQCVPSSAKQQLPRARHVVSYRITECSHWEHVPLLVYQARSSLALLLEGERWAGLID